MGYTVYHNHWDPNIVDISGAPFTLSLSEFSKWRGCQWCQQYLSPGDYALLQFMHPLQHIFWTITKRLHGSRLHVTLQHVTLLIIYQNEYPYSKVKNNLNFSSASDVYEKQVNLILFKKSLLTKRNYLTETLFCKHVFRVFYQNESLDHDFEGWRHFKNRNQTKCSSLNLIHNTISFQHK